MSNAPHDSRQIDVQIEIVMEGNGRLSANDLELALTHFVLRRRKYDPSSRWRLRAAYAAADRKKAEDLFNASAGTGVFEGYTQAGERVLVRELWLENISVSHSRFGPGDGVLHASTTRVDINAGELPGEVVQQQMTIWLTPTPLAVDPKRLASSEVDAISPLGEESRQHPQTTWHSTAGTAELITSHTFEIVQVAGIRARLSVPRPAVYLSVDEIATATNPFELAETVLVELDDLLRVMTLLSRQAVNWVNYEVHTRTKHPTPISLDHHVCRGSQTLGAQATPHSYGPLVSIHSVPASYLEHLTHALVNSTIRGALRPAIVYSVAALRDGYLEAKFFNAFTSLETIVSALDQESRRNQLLRASEFDRLRRAVRDAISAHAVERNIDTATVDTIAKKLPELNRAPIVDRVVSVVEEHRIHWEDLWPAGLKLTEALGAAYRHRNAFIHTGAFPEFTEAYVTTMRMHAIGERLLYQLLGGQAEWLHRTAYRYAKTLAEYTEGSGRTASEESQ
jgi:hypothetical protein